MTVYEATEKKDFRKLASHFRKQPKDTIPFKCWEGAWRDKDLQFIKEQKPELHIFWVEDKKRKIRAIISFEERTKQEFPVPMVTFAFVWVDNKDWISNNGKYFKKMLDWIIRNRWKEYGVVRGEFWGIEKYMKWTKELSKDAMEVSKKRFSHDPVLGPVFFYTIDFEKYVSG